jgi:hypothetical protein
MPNDRGAFESLVADVNAGRCIAFVGAGFTAPARVPTWRNLLLNLAATLPESEAVTADHVKTIVKIGGAERLEEAAQLLQIALGERFRDAVNSCIGKPDVDAMRNRLRHLYGIPFKAVLTTNFDSVMHGAVIDRSTYRNLSHRRTNGRSLYQQALEDGEFGSLEVPTVKLHGDLNDPDSIVFTRSDYRKRLYSNTGYLQFLRSVFLFNTVVYLGFSFTDTYINQLRSETLELLGIDADDEKMPSAFAFVADTPEPTQRYFRQTENTAIIDFSTNGGTDFSEFDRLLEQLYHATSPVVRFGKLMEHRRILWVDPDMSDNANPIRAIDAASAAAGVDKGRRCVVDPVASAQAAVDHLSSPDAPSYDLIISRWGVFDRKEAIAVPLLKGLTSSVRRPVIVFGWDHDSDLRKRDSLSLGALGYYHTYDGLLSAIEHVFSPARD